MLLAVEIALLLILTTPAAALQRCEGYRQDVRRHHSVVFGVDFPYWYAIGQLQQESGCRNVVSEDGVGSQGLPQITWAVWRRYLQKEGVANLITTENQLRAQALVNKDAFNQAHPKRLWIGYQIYNGGRLVLKEIDRAGVADWQAAKDECQRKVVTFSNGSEVNACDINYDYPVKIHSYGEQYRIGLDSNIFPFW